MGHAQFGRALVGMAMLLLAVPCRGEGEPEPWSPYAVAAMAFDDPVVRLAQVEARARISSHWSIGGALAHVDTNAGFEEMQLRLQAIGAASLHGWRFDHRHMITLGVESAERYRLRVRAISPQVFEDSKLSIRAFDELYVDLVRTRQIRNTLAAGLGLELGRRGTVELFHVWSREQGGGGSNYLLAVFILRANP